MGRTFVCMLLVLAPWIVAAESDDFESAADQYRQHHYDVAFKRFMKLAGEGNARAQTVIALMYKFGESVKQDPAKAFHWYRKAADSGYPPAQFNVGVMLIEGSGVDADREAGLSWLKKAAAEGFERARVKLAELDAASAADLTENTNSPESWSRNWNFRLPNDVRFQGNDAKPSWRVRLGTAKTREAANRFWEWLQVQSGHLFENLNPRFVLSENRYRIEAGAFGALDEAQVFCRKLVRQTSDAECKPIRVDQKNRGSSAPR